MQRARISVQQCCLGLESDIFQQFSPGWRQTLPLCGSIVPSSRSERDGSCSLEKRRYDDFDHDANSPRTRRLLAMFLTQQRAPISFIRLKWIASSSQCSTRSCVTLTPAKRSTQMSCFQAARPFSKGLVSTEILRASRRKHHQCCSQTLPMRGSVAPAKSH